MILKLIREGLGRVIVLVDFLTSPRPIQRGKVEQAAAEEAAQTLALYQFYACPFCIKTRRAIRRLNIFIELRDAQNDMMHREVLAAGGGKILVPCLRIEEEGETRWLYESKNIVAYLNARFNHASTASIETIGEVP